MIQDINIVIAIQIVALKFLEMAFAYMKEQVQSNMIWTLHSAKECRTSVGCHTASACMYGELVRWYMQYKYEAMAVISIQEEG